MWKGGTGNTRATIQTDFDKSWPVAVMPVDQIKGRTMIALRGADVKGPHLD